jgi:hypothetical protein
MAPISASTSKSHELSLYIDQPRERAADTMGMIERYTGRVAYNDWEKP